MKSQNLLKINSIKDLLHGFDLACIAARPPALPALPVRCTIRVIIPVDKDVSTAVPAAAAAAAAAAGSPGCAASVLLCPVSRSPLPQPQPPITSLHRHGACQRAGGGWASQQTLRPAGPGLELVGVEADSVPDTGQARAGWRGSDRLPPVRRCPPRAARHRFPGGGFKFLVQLRPGRQSGGGQAAVDAKPGMDLKHSA